jgi:hypothetical protein
VIPIKIIKIMSRVPTRRDPVPFCSSARSKTPFSQQKTGTLAVQCAVQPQLLVCQADSGNQETEEFKLTAGPIHP